ncbi:MAG: sodium-dependent transporter [Gemmatimonadota bacterium]
MIRSGRETFSGSRFGLAMTMIGVAVGLGNVWRFPYMVGKFGGLAFVTFYVAVVVFVGVPALMAEWALGRHTRRGPVGAFAAAGLPLGRSIGWFFFFVVAAATAYYTSVIGWVAYHAVGQLALGKGRTLAASAILPPASGFDLRSFALQALATGLVILACAAVLLRGLRRGIERVSRFITPALFAALVVLVVRSVTLPGAAEGIRWYLLRFDPGDLTPRVMVAAMGQAIFSLSLGGTFMVVYGSYLGDRDDLRRSAGWTAFGDTAAGLLAGLAIIPAVFALGHEASSGPGLLFSTLPAVFREIPAGWLFGFLFFAALLGAAYLSDVAAFEVLVAGLTDNTRLGRRAAVWWMASAVFLLSLPPSLNMNVFFAWDLTFGSGMQTLGALVAVVTIVWVIGRAEALRELAAGGGEPFPLWLYYWMRYAVPGAVLAVGVWWVLTDLLGVMAGV